MSGKQTVDAYIASSPPEVRPILGAIRTTVARYAGPRGNLQFPLSEPIPLALIAKIVKARIKELRNAGKIKDVYPRRPN